MKKANVFKDEALDEMQAAVCDFHRQLINESVRISKHNKRKVVTRRDVELACEGLIDGPDA